MKADIAGGRPVGRHVRATVRRMVRAPIERVYAAYVDPTVLATWMGIRAIADATGPLDRAGTSFTEVVFGPYRSRSEVLAADPPTFHDMTGRGIFGMGYRWRTRFAQTTDGTEMTLDAEAILPGPIGWFTRNFISSGAMKRRTEARLAVFASLVEAREPGR